MDSQTLVTGPVRLPPKPNVTTAVSGGSTCWSGPGARSVGCTKRGPGRFLPGNVWNAERNVSHGKSDHCRRVPAIRCPSGRRARWPSTMSTSDARFASYPVWNRSEVFGSETMLRGAPMALVRVPRKETGPGAEGVCCLHSGSNPNRLLEGWGRVPQSSVTSGSCPLAQPGA